MCQNRPKIIVGANFLLVKVCQTGPKIMIGANFPLKMLKATLYGGQYERVYGCWLMHLKTPCSIAPITTVIPAKYSCFGANCPLVTVCQSRTKIIVGAIFH